MSIVANQIAVNAAVLVVGAAIERASTATKKKGKKMDLQSRLVEALKERDELLHKFLLLVEDVTKAYVGSKKLSQNDLQIFKDAWQEADKQNLKGHRVEAGFKALGFEIEPLP